MTDISQPHHLEDISLIAFGNYVYNLGCSILTDPGPVDIHEACAHVQETLKRTVPPRLADRVTEYLLSRVEDLCAISLEGPKTKLLKQTMLGAVIHPSITKLHFSACVPSFLPPMTLITELRVDNVFLKFNEEVLISALKVMTILQVFCYTWFCTNKILDTLGKYCIELNVLQITGSKKVTNKSVSSILELKKLVQLELFNTKIHRRGITKLLEGLNCDILTNFSCNNVSRSQLKLITNKMPKVRNIKFQTKKYDSASLRKFSKLQTLGLCKVNFKKTSMSIVRTWPDSFKYLNVLSLTKMKFSSAYNLLYEVGNKITELVIHEVKYISAIAIAETCPVLKTLKIIDCYEDGHAKELWNNFNETPLFQSIEEVVIHLEDDVYFIIFVLCCCTNVKKVDVGLFGDDVDEDIDNPDILESVLVFNKLTQLQEFHTMQVLKEDVIRQIVQQCTNLTLLTGKLV
ncbi:hypothetical protein L9F63_006437, partial [Diploptera punctata]